MRAHSLDLCTFSSYEFFRRWQDTRWKERGREYEQVGPFGLASHI